MIIVSSPMAFTDMGVRWGEESDVTFSEGRDVAVHFLKDPLVKKTIFLCFHFAQECYKGHANPQMKAVPHKGTNKIHTHKRRKGEWLKLYRRRKQYSPLRNSFRVLRAFGFVPTPSLLFCRFSFVLAFLRISLVLPRAIATFFLSRYTLIHLACTHPETLVTDETDIFTSHTALLSACLCRLFVSVPPSPHPPICLSMSQIA